MRSLVLIENDVPLADSRKIAGELETNHKNFRELLQDKQEYIEKYFGVLRFTTAKPSADSVGGRPEKYVLLTEEQSYYALTFCENTPRAMELRARLIKEFMEAKRQIAGLKAQLELGQDFALPTMDVEALRQEADKEDRKKLSCHYRAKYLRQMARQFERQALKPQRKLLALPGKEPVKKLPKPQPTLREKILGVLQTRLAPEETASARQIAQWGATQLRGVGSPTVRKELDRLAVEGAVVKEGEGRTALYGLPYLPKVS